MTRSSPNKAGVFTREATGLVKSANRLEATVWNVANIMGSKFPWSVARLGLFPAALILGWSPYLWAVVLIGVAGYVLGILYVQTASAMPRSGADYVIPSRLMGPFWGWIQSWMILCSLVPFWGFSAWVTIRNVKQLFDILRIGGLTTLSVPWILTGTPALVAGILVILAGMTICFLPARRYYQAVTAIGLIAILSLVIMATGAAVVTQASFADNLKPVLGVSSDTLVQTAMKKGFDPNQGLDFATTAALAGVVLFGMNGFQSSATISGELRGKTRNSLLVSILGSLTLFLVLFVPLVWIFLIKFNYNLVLAWSYLFWNSPTNAPLRLPPINALLLTVAAPNMAPLWAVVGFAAVVGGWLGMPASMLYTNRIVLYWGVDRMVPATISEVSPRFRQPLKLFAIQGVVAIACFGLTLLNFNPVNYLWWATLLLAPAFIFPGISALLLPRKHPELMQNVPWRRWLVPLAVLWLIIIVPFYAFAGFIGSIPTTTPGSSLWQYAMSTGLSVTLFAILAGIAIYMIVRAYNVRRGVDVKLIYKSIPPE
jgi:APA family basic amino acid/polyamine antiporter